MGEMIFYILLSVTGAIQMVVYAAWVWPVHAKVDEQIFLYVLFLAGCFGIFALARQKLRQYWKNPESQRRLVVFLCIEMILTFFLLSALFKLIVYARWPRLALKMYHVLLLLLLLNKVFYKSVLSFLQEVYSFIIQERNRPMLGQLAIGGFVVAIIFLLYLPDPLGVVARVYMGEQFHNWDICIFAPAYAYSKGNLIYVDENSHYGLGMPMVFAYLTKLLGGLTYEHMLIVLMWMCIVYYITWFFLLRQWLGGLLIPIAAILFGLRNQLFHAAAYPLTFTYPSGTPMRFYLDVAVFFLVWRHIKTQRSNFLYAASACCGFMLFYMFAEGLYLTTAFYTYLFLCLTSKRGRGLMGKQSPWRVSSYFILAPLITFIFIFLTQGMHIFSSTFWQNSAEFRDYYLNGKDIAPIYNTLQAGFYLQSLMGFVVPLVYMLTVLIAGSFWYLGRGSDKYLLAVLIAIEGLGLYHYYVLLAGSDSYYMLGLPYNILIAFWVNEGLALINVRYRRQISMGLVAVCLWALLTNQNFISYPNLMNLSRNPLVDTSVVQFPASRASYFAHLFREYPEFAKLPLNSLGEKDEQLKVESDFKSDEDLKAYFLKDTDFSTDAKLIQKWTAPDERVALISSFEIEMLLQADRRPFFYYFPLLNSRPLRMRMFHVTGLDRHAQFVKTIDLLEQRKPAYIFMERLYLNRKIPASYFYDTPGLVGLVEYVDEHYVPQETGQYLVAMKRI